MPSFCFAPLMLRRPSSSATSTTSTPIFSPKSSERPSRPETIMNCDTSIARSIVGFELRSWNPSSIPRTRHMCGETSWAKLHEVAFATFERDPDQYAVHFHRDSFRHPNDPSKPRMSQQIWATGIYHNVALRIRGDRTFVIYAHFVKK